MYICAKLNLIFNIFNKIIPCGFNLEDEIIFIINIDPFKAANTYHADINIKLSSSIKNLLSKVQFFSYRNVAHL